MLTTLPLWKIIVQVVVVGMLMTYWTLRPDPRRRLLQFCIAAEVLYGVIQDQFTVRLCAEYFTVAHPRIEGLSDPTLLGIAWGFLGSWWGGAILGTVIGFVAQLGTWPRIEPRALLGPIMLLLIFQAAITATAGCIGMLEAVAPDFSIIEPLASQIPAEHHQACFIASRMHQGTYLSAVVGGVVVCLWVGWQRFALNACSARGEEALLQETVARAARSL